MSCDFVSWLDNEWPETMKNALGRLWGMYNDNNTARTDQRIKNAKLFKVVVDEKNNTWMKLRKRWWSKTNT
jgi:hypothetical protein